MDYLFFTLEIIHGGKIGRYLLPIRKKLVDTCSAIKSFLQLACVHERSLRHRQHLKFGEPTQHTYYFIVVISVGIIHDDYCFLKERNSPFENEELSIQRMKNSFVCNLWSWTKLFIDDGPLSCNFFDWLGSRLGQVLFSVAFFAFGSTLRRLLYTSCMLWDAPFFLSIHF